MILQQKDQFEDQGLLDLVDHLQLQEIEERHGTLYRVLAQYDHVPLVQYRIQVMAVAQQFLDFIEGKDYRPLLPDTVPIVRQLLLQLHQMVLKPDTPAT